ncbi:hypothetical protein E7V44_20980 [Escherichia coli]|nr:hypothetical protein [Escherichia coli]
MTRTDLHRCYSPISFTVIRSGGADFIFSASERVVKAFTWPARALVCLRGVLCGGERVRA